MKKYNPNKFLLKIPRKPTQKEKNRMMEIMTPTSSKVDEVILSRREQLDFIEGKFRKSKLKSYNNY
jgi:hypothetical protein